jgi:YVTN family beta-propeller protein
VWTIFPSDVVRYDPATGSLSLSPGAEGAFSFPADLAVGADAVWVSAGATTRFNLPTISRLDPATAAIVASVSGQSLARGDSLSAIWPTVGEGGIWAASQQGRVARIDPATNAMSEPIDVSDALHGIAAGEGALWALNANDDSVLRIDPTTLRVTGTVRVGRSPTALAAGAGAVWVTSERDGTVTRIDPATFDVETIDVGGPATDVAVGLGGVWVTVDVQ